MFFGLLDWGRPGSAAPWHRASKHDPDPRASAKPDLDGGDDSPHRGALHTERADEHRSPALDLVVHPAEPARGVGRPPEFAQRIDDESCDRIDSASGNRIAIAPCLSRRTHDAEPDIRPRRDAHTDTEMRCRAAGIDVVSARFRLNARGTALRTVLRVRGSRCPDDEQQREMNRRRPRTARRQVARSRHSVSV